jgi:hypothetical protein
MQMKNFLLTILTAAAVVLSGCAAQMATYTSDSANVLLDRSKSALCLPIDSLHVTYIDNTKAAPDTLFNDSFFIEAANGLLAYEVSQAFSVCPLASDSLDSLQVFRRTGYSILDKDTTYLRYISLRVQALAKKYRADLVIVPYACEIKHLSVQPAGWRQDRFGPGYERPISYTAKTSFHVQIWTKDGTILYERTGRSDTGRPIMYSFLKNEKNPGKDIVKYAKRFYAPPLVKSLFNSIKMAMMVRI